MRIVTSDLIDVMGLKPLKEIMAANEAEKLVELAKDELMEGGPHMYIEYFFWYAQKPPGW